MKNIYFLLTIIASTMLLSACDGKRKSFDKDNDIGSFGQPIKIEFYKHIQGQAFKYNIEPEFALTAQTDINEALQEIKDASNPEPWKGAGWDRIVIIYSDTIIKINTNKKKIGLSASGTFYTLTKTNFITKQLKD
jgi:hypothetical protein